jgi:hypothetical protein
MSPDFDERMKRRKFQAFMDTAMNGECFIFLGPQNIVSVLEVTDEVNHYVWVQDVFSGETFQCHYSTLSPRNAMEVMAHAAQ